MVAASCSAPVARAAGSSSSGWVESIRPVKVVPGHWNTDRARVLGEGREPGRWRADGREVSDGAQEESAARKRFHSWGRSSPMRAWGCVCPRSST